MHDRGISDVLAFVLIFAVVIASGSLVATAGLDQLTDLRDYEQVQSSERAMEVAAADLSELQEGAPITQLEFALNGGNIGVTESSLQVNVTGTGVDTDSINDTYQINSLQHRVSRGNRDVTLAYESGAVFRSDGGTFRREPRWYANNGTVIVTIVSLRERSGTIDISGSSSRQGDGIDPRGDVPQDAPARDAGQTVRIVAESNVTAQQQWYGSLDGSDSATVQVDVSATAYPDQWARSLDRAGWEQNGTYRYEAEADESLLIRHVVIDLS
ncbi:DUF7289 family protein [Haloarcula salinisoli]|uniref:Uncharacterized protein n=1 Tax=Haloarcula salinisoli TaxID=2487746 RepID=A0A8J8CAX4_9EURY|nr:hypothetical protein [Halomicroarcula salinisoli]MBX0284864.1 hypothetical protein [Halomicroarcula salinisoli]MBX0303658.1 hypothetical protein [Halomicroarcula salinisoli]